MQEELFPESDVEGPKHRCNDCANIIGARFQSKTLFFCTANKSFGGRYGKKINKSAPACPFYTAGAGDIERIDGYYGGRLDGVKR